MIAPANQQLTQIFSEARLFQAWEEVAAKHSAPGFDHVTIEDFSRNPGLRLRALREHLIQGRYRPDPLVTFFKEKPSGGLRTLNIATVRDRIVCRLLADTMVETHDRDLQPQCYSYRPHRGALQAVRAAQQACRQYAWAARVDIADFFDSLDHEIMEDTLSSRGWSEPVVDIVKRLAKAPRFDGVRHQVPAAGVPMGLPIAPVLSNLYLDDFDHALQNAEFAFLRYADDIVIFAPSDQEANSALAEVRLQLNQLHLVPNTDKTRIYRCEDGFLFLGFLFRPQGHTAGHEAVARLRSKLAEPPYDDETEAAYQSRRNAIQRGWRNYYQKEGSRDAAERRREGWQRKQEKAERQQAEQQIAQTPPPEPDPAITAEPDDTPEIETVSYSIPATDASTESRIQPLLAECREWEKAGRHSEIIYNIRRFLGDDAETGTPSERGHCRQMLANAYEALGLTGAARCCRHESADDRDLSFTEKQVAADTPVHTANNVESWLEVFGGEDIRIARQFIDRLGRHGYRPATHGLSPKDLQRHWEGRETLAVPVYRKNDRVPFGVLDLDITRKCFDAISLPERKILLEKLLDDARHLLDRAASVGIRAVLEDSGCKGYHLWFFLHTPLEAALVREFLAELCRVAGPPPEGTHRELFPASDHAPQEAIGRYIKLPLGIHRLTGKRSRFLAPDGIPCANGTELLDRSFRNRAEALRNALRNWQRYQPKPQHPSQNPARRSEEPADIAESKSVKNGFHPNVEQLLNHCTVLAGIRQKAAQEHHLSHADHSVLRSILGALPQGGAAAIHQILRPCRNYSRAVTERFLIHTHDKPMGCMRIREILGEFCNQTGCNCRFRAKKSDYAHPLRWLDATPQARSTPATNPAIPQSRNSPPTNPAVSQSRNSPPTNPAVSQSRNAPIASLQPTDDVATLLTHFHTARKELLAAQALLMAATASPEKAILPFGTLRQGEADPAIFRWTIET